MDGPGSNPGGDEIFRPSSPALGPTQPPIQWVPSTFPGVKCGRSVLLTTHHLLVPRSWKSRAILLPTLWGHTGPVTGSLYLYCSFNPTGVITPEKKEKTSHISTKLVRVKRKEININITSCLDFKLSPCYLCSMFSFGYFPGV
jgi:hypothetical protein